MFIRLANARLRLLHEMQQASTRFIRKPYEQVTVLQIMQHEWARKSVSPLKLLQAVIHLVGQIHQVLRVAQALVQSEFQGQGLVRVVG